MKEARFLFDSDFHTAAVYLAGYAVECALKALLLSSEPHARHAATLASFRGTKGHDFAWLVKELARRRVVVSPEMNRQVGEVAWWSTDLRYEPRDIKAKTATRFLLAADA